MAASARNGKKQKADPKPEQPHWAGREMTKEEIDDAHQRLETIRNKARLATAALDVHPEVQTNGDGPPGAPGNDPIRVPGRPPTTVPVAVHYDGLGKRGLDRSALPAHKILMHWTRLLAWCNEQVLKEHTSIPRPAIKNIAWRLADRLVEEHGDRLVEWMEGKG